MAEVSPAEAKQFCAWAWLARNRTTFDSKIIGHPKTVMFISENGDGAKAYLPVQTVLMAEVFIPKPDSTNREKAYSLGIFDSALMKAARAVGISEVYCYVPFEEMDYANKIQNHGWKPVERVMLFKKAVS